LQYIQVFLQRFSSHCSTQNIGFSDSSYIIKPPQPSSAIYGALPFRCTATVTILNGRAQGTIRCTATVTILNGIQ